VRWARLDVQASRHAFSHSPIQLFVEDSIPPSPHATNNVRVSESAYERRGGRMPGYTGYMPDSAHWCVPLSSACDGIM